jgi:hypothetical protein
MKVLKGLTWGANAEADAKMAERTAKDFMVISTSLFNNANARWVGGREETTTER